MGSQMGMETIQKGGEPMDYKVISVMDHYEAYATNGKFICSGDTQKEAEREAEKYLAERR